MQVHQILRAKPQGNVMTVAPDSSVADAARLLAERRIGAVIVSGDGEKPLGILSGCARRCAIWGAGAWSACPIPSRR